LRLTLDISPAKDNHFCQATTNTARAGEIVTMTVHVATTVSNCEQGRWRVSLNLNFESLFGPPHEILARGNPRGHHPTSRKSQPNQSRIQRKTIGRFAAAAAVTA
jgi:hypothetical protein